RIGTRHTYAIHAYRLCAYLYCRFGRPSLFAAQHQTNPVMTRCHANLRTLQMAVLDTHRSEITAAPIGLGLSRLVAAFTAWNDARVTRKALSVLSDRELEDIGLTRADIASFSMR